MGGNEQWSCGIIWLGGSLIWCWRVRWNGRGRPVRLRGMAMWGWSVWKNDIVGGETVEHVGERADGVIARALLANGATHRVALFAHAHILRILAARRLALGGGGGELFALGTGSLSVLGWERETRVIQHWNRGFEG